MSDTVLIVDDEPIIRNGLVNFIDWSKLGFHLAGSCANGQEALEMMSGAPIDILITDIKMPVMDGLQLTRKALELNPQLKVVLISSYNEFEYVREGMKHGAVDYLLKPSLEAEELTAVLGRCKEMLEQDRSRTEQKRQLDRQFSVLERKRLEQEIIRELVSGGSDAAFQDMLGERGAGVSYLCAFIVIDGLAEQTELYGHLHIGMMYEEIQEVFYGLVPSGSAPVLAGEGLFVLFAGGEEAEALLGRLKARIEAELAATVSVGYCVEPETRGVKGALDKSRSAAMRRFFEGTGRIFGWKPEAGGQETAQEPAETNMQAMVDAIREANNAKTVIDGFSGRWSKGGMTPEQVKREAYELLSAFAYLNGDAKLLSDYRENIRRCETAERLAELLYQLCEELEQPSLVKLSDKGHSGQLIAKAIEYIKLHYREELTLQEVADSIHVSKSYFSNLFKKQAGQNFIDYLIDLRLHEAKRMLTQKDYKIYEVAEKSGFNDVKYFSKLFKRMTQMTPVEYREKHQQ
ncbi:response regulator [Paenibacillus sp. N4]|uniref:response regulator transcription factor n=1 Tax=Paenibacillus vietnamensis TaxID=2590547 RepID=UPI001CD0B026|nr:response regulator [Paenibacillus vietnamensis]MCA0758747.1 response regulator [Paenibacillus vietnamensis]